MSTTPPKNCSVDPTKLLKRQCHEIFCFRFFSWIAFPLAPDNNFRIISNFFENSQRYSQVKVHHRCQRNWWQICHQCQWHRWQIATSINDTGRKFATGINDTGGKFCHQFPLCCLHLVSTIPAANLPPVSTTPVANCHRYQRHRRHICHRCHWHRWRADTWKWTWRQKFIYMFPLLPKGGQTKLLKFFWLKIFSICHWCQRHWWQTLSCEYLREFSKKFKTVLKEYSGAGGKLIHEKNQKQKISWHCPFNKMWKKFYLKIVFFIASVVDTADKHSLVNISANFRKNLKWS